MDVGVGPVRGLVADGRPPQASTVRLIRTSGIRKRFITHPPEHLFICTL